MAHQVILQWQASADSVDGYNVYRGTTAGQENIKLNAALVSGLTFTDTTVVVATYFYIVKSSVGGVESVASNEISVTVPSGGSASASIAGTSALTIQASGKGITQSIVIGQSVVTSPINGTGAIAASIAGQSSITVSLAGTGTHQVSLQWQPSSDAVDGYNVYRGFNSGQENTQVNPSLVIGTAFTDTTVTFATYFYVIKSSVNGIESVASNEIEVTVPQGATISTQIAGQATVTSVIAGSGTADAQIAGQSTVIVSATGTGATITGQSSVVVSLVGDGTFDAEFIGQATLVVQPAGSISSPAVITGQSTLTVSGHITTGAIAVITGTSTVAVNTGGVGSIAAILAGQATLTVLGAGAIVGASNIAGTSTVSGSLFSGNLGLVHIVGSSTFGAALTGAGSSAASINGHSNIIVEGLGLGSIAAILNGNAIIQAVFATTILLPPVVQLVSSKPVKLSWTSAPLATGYNVYRGPTANSVTLKLNSTPVTDTTFSANKGTVGLEFYAVTSVAGNVESGLSNIIDVTSLAPASGTITYRHNPRDFKVKR